MRRVADFTAGQGEGDGVGNDLQVEQAGQSGVVGQVPGETAGVEAQGLLEHQAGEKLGLGFPRGPDAFCYRNFGIF